ncbi:MAG: glutamate--tRNA ligase [Deltaproteobacteria bacterium]|jgi:glutamyl-tRNA synthetase|nr:glutamate--tRNA ligase [Deltaproteobacteria bacterium]
MKPRVRFAPSPTGALHIGGARTALFNWLFAKHHDGVFVLRIEDTDRERSTKEFEKSILEGMRWLGMDWDEGPFYQTQRMEIYKGHVKKLMEEGKAYPCTCSPEELDESRKKAMAEGRKPKYDGTCRNGVTHPDRPAVIRFKAPQDGTTKFHDICRGTISFNNAELDDLIIARSDGTPTYNFTVVIDDVTMDMTHIIRGDDHINNTPKQVMLYNALGYKLPEFAHLPMIHGSDKKKLSKRHGAASVMEYKELGYLPEGLVNYLARLGWAHGDQEIFDFSELIKIFDLDAVSNSPSIFDTEKLEWVNSQHIVKKTNAELVELTRPFFTKIDISLTDDNYAIQVMEVERERARTLKELANISTFFFNDEISIDPKAASKWLKPEQIGRLQELREAIQEDQQFSVASLSKIFNEMAERNGLKMLKIAQPVRVAMTGSTASPGIFEVLTILGKERVLKRFDAAIKGNS